MCLIDTNWILRRKVDTAYSEKKASSHTAQRLFKKNIKKKETKLNNPLEALLALFAHCITVVPA